MSWIVFTVVTLLLIFVYQKIVKSLNFWSDRGVLCEKPWPVLGNMALVTFRQKPFAHLLQSCYEKFGNARYFGFYQFNLPTLMIRDPELVKRICIKDFDSFTDHQEFLPRSTDPFWSRNLFSMAGKEWHDMRCILSPAFTGNKMKGMFTFMQECAQNFIDYFKTGNETITIEFKETFNRFTNDVIASTAFGCKIDSLKDKDNEFFKIGRNAFNFEGLKSLKFFGYALSPTLMKLLRVRFFDDYTKTFFSAIITDTIKQREQHGVVRPDMIHLLREAQKGRLKHESSNAADTGYAVVQETNMEPDEMTSKPQITDDDILSQAMVFFFGGFDTVSTLMCQMAYELAANPDVQVKLRQEIGETLRKCNGKLTYDALMHMKYLDMVTTETLRLWSPAIFLNRKAVKSVTIEPENAHEKPLVIEPGMAIWIPVYAIHRDPNYYPDPDKFSPERFSDENKHNIQSFTYMPFGTGPRNCIASRFALLEAKVIIFYILSEFEIVPVERTKIPFSLSRTNINITSSCGYWFGLKPQKCLK